MSNFSRIAVAAAAVLIVAAVVGLGFLSGQGEVGGQGSGATPVRSPIPTPAATLMALTTGEIAAGTYVARPFAPPNDSIGFRLTVPDGWSAGGPKGRPPVAITPATGFTGPDGMQLGFLTVDSLEADPCHWTASTDTPVGRTVDDLVNALAAHSGYETSDPTDVTLGGFSGKRIDVLLPADLDLADCDEEQFWVWADGDGQAIYAQGPEGRFHLWILDVRGQRVIAMTHDFPGTSSEDLAELQGIVDSIQIEP